MTRCTCYYEISEDTIRHDIDPKCGVHGDDKDIVKWNRKRS